MDSNFDKRLDDLDHRLERIEHTFGIYDSTRPTIDKVLLQIIDLATKPEPITAHELAELLNCSTASARMIMRAAVYVCANPDTRYETDFIDDELIDEAYEVVKAAGKASTTLLQTRLSVGYARAARLIQAMEDEDLIGPANGAKPRVVYAKKKLG